MFDRFAAWRYSDNANCWDFVREYLMEKAGLNLPRFGAISPSDKRGMTKAALSIQDGFVKSAAIDFAIACHYMERAIIHVGVVKDGRVWHTGKQHGTTSHTISDFEKMAPITIYRIHKSLCQT